MKIYSLKLQWLSTFLIEVFDRVLRVSALKIAMHLFAGQVLKLAEASLLVYNSWQIEDKKIIMVMEKLGPGGHVLDRLVIKISGLPQISNSILTIMYHSL